MPQCGKCKAYIEFYRMAGTGNLMPIDPKPMEDGTLEIIEDRGQKVLRSFRPAEDDDGVAMSFEDNPYKPLRYRSHFATCTAADFYRKRIQ